MTATSEPMPTTAPMGHRASETGPPGALRPIVSVVIPARNEENDIAGAIESVLGQEYPLDRLQVVVVDGDSQDRTLAVAERCLVGRGLQSYRLIQNRSQITPRSLNIGLAAATGEYLCRVDARSRLPLEYVDTCVKLLEQEPTIAVVGGAQVAIPPKHGARGIGIARALNNPLGMGMSKYRRGARSGPTDTVYLGFFRSEQLRSCGGWNESFPTNQDFELNRRLAASTGDVWFIDGIGVSYVPRSTVGDLFRQYHRFGRWKVRYWRSTGDRPRPRQLVLLAGPPAVVALTASLVVAGPPLARRLAAVSALAAAVVVERASAGPSARGPGARAVQVAALASVASGWQTGVIRELLVGNLAQGSEEVSEPPPGRS